MYIGSTIRKPEKRWKEHRNESAKGVDYYLYNSMRKYGIDNFSFEVIDSNSVSTYEELLLLETKYIRELNTLKPNGYNLTEGGIGGDRLYLLDSEKRAEKYRIISAKNREIQQDPERTKNRRDAYKKWRNELESDPDKKKEFINKCKIGLRKAWENKVLTVEEKEKYSKSQKERFLRETKEEKQERIRKFKEASGTAKKWKLTFPDGKHIIICSIFDYCKENNLPYNIIYGCHRKKKASKHGWNLEEI